MPYSAQRPSNEVKNFVLSSYFGDGLRITFGVLFPSLLLLEFDKINVGMTISLGALCASVVDSPGPIVHRRNAMLTTTLIVCFVALCTGLANLSAIFLGILIAGFSFFFSMFYVYGLRAASIGTAALLVMTLSIGDGRPLHEIILHALYILIGGAWYTALSISLYRIMPYRLAQQSLGDCIVEVAKFMKIKAGFYKENINYDENYTKLIEAQIVVNEKQDAVRELLFKTREIVRESTQEGRFLVVVFVDLIDLFEQIMSTFYNYKNLHQQFDSVGILQKYEAILTLLADELENIGYAMKLGTTPHLSPTIPRRLQELHNAILELENGPDAAQFNTLSIGALKNIEVNIKNIFLRLKKIVGNFKNRKKKSLSIHGLETTPFIAHQEYEAKAFKENLTFDSEIFRHSIRVALVMLVGYIIAQSFAFLHSNWILLTIMVIMKPAFSLTKERNYHRLIGTIIGAIFGLLILSYQHNKQVLFVILLFCMLGAYSFQRKNYVVSVLFMTPFVLILYDFLGMGNISVLEERVMDTFIGGGISFIASYFLFPSWEKEKLKKNLVEMLSANLQYFRQVRGLYLGNEFQSLPHKLARKNVYVKTANLASAFQRMFSEPKSKQTSIKEVHQFSVLNHLFSSYTATLALYVLEHFDEIPDFDDIQHIADNTEKLLETSIKVLQTDHFKVEELQLLQLKNHHKHEDEGILLIPEQYVNIQKAAFDICKISERIKI